MTLLWLQVRYRYRALLGIRDVRQGRLRAQIEQAKARRARRSVSEQYERFGRSLATAFAEGMDDPRPLTAEEMAELVAYTGGVARRSFSALYDGED